MLASPPAMNGDHGPMLDRNNIINVRDGESLYQICIKLRRRLSGVPGFRPYLEEMEEREAEGSDPVSSLWQCFRSGLPLLTIYNASNPEEGDLRVDTKRPERVGKEAAFLFIKACMQQMEIPAADTFTVTDLYSDNTTGFVKVTKLINRVLDILKLSGKLRPSTDSEGSRDGADSALNVGDQAPKTLTRRQHILKELVETERQYVHHLQNLQSLKKEMEEVGALTGDAIHNIFLNLNNLLDFAQRFLIRIEQQNETPEEQQNWGRLFVHYKDPFRQYEPFIANQRRCETTCQQEWDRMVERAKSPLAQQMLANPTILNGFLLKPFQRLTKYPMLLKVGGSRTPGDTSADILGSSKPNLQQCSQIRPFRRNSNHSRCLDASRRLDRQGNSGRCSSRFDRAHRRLEANEYCHVRRASSARDVQRHEGQRDSIGREGIPHLPFQPHPHHVQRCQC